MTDRITATVLDAVGSVCADLTGIRFVYAAGVTASVQYDTPIVVPQADEIVDGGLPCVVVGLGPWALLNMSAQRITYELQLAVCHPRQPVGEVIPRMLDHVDELMQGFEAHAKAYLHGEEPAWNISSALITGGGAISPRELRASADQPGRVYLVAPVTCAVVVNRTANYQPA